MKDDLISRHAAIDEVHKEFDECLVWDESGECTADEVERILESLPSAHPLNPCETCLHKGKGWDEDPCDGCTGTESKYIPDNGWIPVDEGRPKDGTACLVTYSKGLVEIATFIEDLYEFDAYDFHDKRGMAGWIYFDSECGQYFDVDNVVAWMPLPEPYKGESDG